MTRHFFCKDCQAVSRGGGYYLTYVYVLCIIIYLACTVTPKQHLTLTGRDIAALSDPVGGGVLRYLTWHPLRMNCYDIRRSNSLGIAKTAVIIIMAESTTEEPILTGLLNKQGTHCISLFLISEHWWRTTV